MSDEPISAPIAITMGEPAGIGPEIAVRAAWELRATAPSILIGDADSIKTLAHDLQIHLQIIAQGDFERGASTPCAEERLTVIDCKAAVPVVPGQLNVKNAPAVLRMLDCAIAGAISKRFAAIVTAPIQKGILQEAGIAFSGHTEYFANKTGTPHVVMMLTGAIALPSAMAEQAALKKTALKNVDLQKVDLKKTDLQKTDLQKIAFRVALATTHLPLKKVAQALTYSSLLQTLTILADDLKNKFAIANPRILVTGLNPHAGENGYLGREEIDVIQPAIQAAQQRGIDARGPYPADTVFQEKYLAQADCVLAMYHDQGLPVLKYATFGHGVNITLGLPIIRTSVDHGTALDLAAVGTGHADIGSMRAALQLAADLAYAK